MTYSHTDIPLRNGRGLIQSSSLQAPKSCSQLILRVLVFTEFRRARSHVSLVGGVGI